MVLKILRSRKFAKRTLTALLILIIPAFILWGIGTISKGPSLIGTIGRQKIYTDDLARSVQGVKIQVLFSYAGNFNTLNQILANRPLINYMAWERLILLNATRRKVPKISNKDVTSFITRHPVFQRNGTFDDKVYNYILRNTLSMEPRQFEELVRENLQIHAFRQNLLKDVKVSEEDVKEYYRQTTDKVVLSYILIDKDFFKNQVSISDKEAEAFYEENKGKFFEPPKIEVDYIEMPYKNISERNSIVQKIEEVLPELRTSPDEFKKIAKRNDLNYGRAEPFSRDDVIPGIPFFKDFHDTAFELKKGDISLPLFSSEGDSGKVYLLHKIKDIPAKQESFEKVRTNLIKELTDIQSFELARKKAAALYTEMTENAMTLKEAAEELELKVKTTKPLAYNGYIENVGPTDIIVFYARKTGTGKIMPPIPVKKGVFLSYVDEIIPSKENDFEDKKENLYKQLLGKKQIKTLRTWFDENKVTAQLKKPLDKL